MGKEGFHEYKTVAIAPVGFFVTVALFAFAFVALQSTSVYAQGDTKDATSEQKDEKKTDTKKSAATYKYVAQVGDSYSKIARKAVQTYGLKHDVKLSGAQIVFAETNLTRAAQSPILMAGEKVSVAESDVQSWVERAQKLNDAQKTAWNYYVQFVNFNTDNVGEARS